VTLTTPAAFLAAIAAAPDDDTVRLVFADYLDENGEGERAEFIRVQCEIARWTNPLKCPQCGAHYDYSCEMDGHAEDGGFKDSAELGCANDHFWRHGDISALRRRERELFERFCREDMAAEFGLPAHESLYAIEGGLMCVALSLELRFSRGFPSVVRAEMRVLYGGECECVEQWQLDRSPMVLPGGCYACHGTGRTPGVLPDMVARWPMVERVEVTDREPHVLADGFAWVDDDTGEWTGGVPHDVFVLIETSWHRADGFQKAFVTIAEALAALSTALLAWAKRRDPAG
jgi:uncharacterized protein (TIGR02996 family)